VGANEQGQNRLEPGRYYLLGDAGSFYFDPAGDNDGFESPEAAVEWARTQEIWPELTRDLREGVAPVVLGSEWNANQAAQEAASPALSVRILFVGGSATRPAVGGTESGETIASTSESNAERMIAALEPHHGPLTVGPA
jgi:hypothetical protein